MKEKNIFLNKNISTESIDISKSVEKLNKFNPDDKELMGQYNKSKILKSPEFLKLLMSKGEYCGYGLIGELRALELAVSGKGTPAHIGLNDLFTIRQWVSLGKEDFDSLISFDKFGENKQTLFGHQNFDFKKPLYSLFYPPSELEVRKEDYLHKAEEIRDKIKKNQEMMDYAKANGQLIKTIIGSRLLRYRFEPGKYWLVDKDNKTYIVSEEEQIRVFKNLSAMADEYGLKEFDVSLIHLPYLESKQEVIDRDTREQEHGCGQRQMIGIYKDEHSPKDPAGHTMGQRQSVDWIDKKGIKKEGYQYGPSFYYGLINGEKYCRIY